jgi:hypothetical protein
MTAERSRAYARVMRTIEDMGPAKLHEIEQRRIRNAADTLVFAAEDDRAVLDALDDAAHLAYHLVASGRWTSERAYRLLDDVADCGPAWTTAGIAGRAA